MRSNTAGALADAVLILEALLKGTAIGKRALAERIQVYRAVLEVEGATDTIPTDECVRLAREAIHHAMRH